MVDVVDDAVDLARNVVLNDVALVEAVELDVGDGHEFVAGVHLEEVVVRLGLLVHLLAQVVFLDLLLVVVECALLCDPMEDLEHAVAVDHNQLVVAVDLAVLQRGFGHVDRVDVALRVKVPNGDVVGLGTDHQFGVRGEFQVVDVELVALNGLHDEQPPVFKFAHLDRAVHVAQQQEEALSLRPIHLAERRELHFANRNAARQLLVELDLAAQQVLHLRDENEAVVRIETHQFLVGRKSYIEIQF
mmetsp:Transcript_105640/g.227704  ORF Transcript_105640/g.227704 Transcript_105640/m.227704 type:complete len:245 (+) Transcript_105640:624-1358(+)